MGGKTSGPGSFTGPAGKAASFSPVYRLSPVKSQPVSSPDLGLPDSVIADLSSGQLLLYQLTRSLHTGNIAQKEVCKKIGPLNQARQVTTKLHLFFIHSLIIYSFIIVFTTMSLWKLFMARKCNTYLSRFSSIPYARVCV